MTMAAAIATARTQAKIFQGVVTVTSPEWMDSPSKDRPVKVLS